MSLLLDALKEAEARKREAAPPMDRTPPPATPPSFETEGSLALAEDYVAASEPQEPARTGAPVAPQQAAASTAAMASPAVPSKPAATPGAAALLAARAARAASAAVPSPMAPAAGSPGVSTAAPTGGPTPAPTTRGSARPAQRGLLTWLVGASVMLGLLFAGLALYDGFVNQPVAPYVPPAARSLPTGEAEANAEFARPVPDTSVAGPASRGTSPAAAPAVGQAAGPGRRATARPAPPAEAPLRGRDAAPTIAAEQPGRPPGPPDAAGVRISVSRETAPLAAAWDALQAGDLASAESRYREVLQSEPGQVDALLGLAVIAQSRGEDEAARRGFRRVLESVPDHPRAWAGLAELAGEGDAGAIESRLRQLLADRPSAPLHFALGNLLARQQRWVEAQPEYFAAATLAPQAADYAFNVAVALDRLGKAGAALPWYERALDAVARGRAARFDADTVRGRVAQLRAASP